MHNPVGQTNDYDPYGQHKYQPPPPPEDDFMNPHPSLYPASHQYHQQEQHRQQQQQQIVDRPNTIELNNSYGASAMPLPAPAFQYNPTQVRFVRVELYIIWYQFLFHHIFVFKFSFRSPYIRRESWGRSNLLVLGMTITNNSKCNMTPMAGSHLLVNHTNFISITRYAISINSAKLIHVL